MGFLDRARHKAQEVVGEVEETVGEPGDTPEEEDDPVTDVPTDADLRDRS